MAHYICKGECKGVSDKPKVCKTKDCSKHKEPLTECNCVDNKHESDSD